MDYGALIEKVYDHLENDDVAKAVMTCLRLARHLKDHFYSTLFLHELFSDKCQRRRVFFDDTHDLNEEAKKLLWERALEDWLEEHKLNYSLDPDDKTKNVLGIAVGEINTQIDQLEKSISDLTLPTGMGEFDTAAFTDRYYNWKIQYRVKIQAIQTIKERIKTRCLNYAIRIEKELASQSKSEVFLHTIQNEVNNYFQANSDEVYSKLQKALHLINSTDPEDQSLLLTLVRKAIKEVSDFFYPPVSGSVICSDGKERQMGEEQYLNRLQEYIIVKFGKTTSDELLQAELEHLAIFARRLNDIASKGIHTTASVTEAKQGLLGLYFFLFNLISKLQKKDS